MHYDLFEAIAKQRAAGDALIMAASGFVNATLKAATVAGRIAAENPPPPETEKPDTPTGLAAVPLVSGSTFWAAFCDVAESNDSNPVVGYRFYENGVPVGQGPSPEFVMRNRTPSTAYSIQVSSYTLYRESDLSAAIVITTDASGGNPPAADTTPPTSPVLVSVEATNSTTIEATYETSTDSGSGVALYYLEIDGQLVTPAAHPFDSMVWAALQPGRTYRVRILADDLAGNRSAPSNEIVITMPGAVVPPIPGRTISGAMTTAEPLVDGLIKNAPPSPPGRSISGNVTLAAATSAGTITNRPTADQPPVWVSPAVDTEYSYNEGDTIAIVLDADDPEGQAVSILENSGIRPQDVSLTVTAQGVWMLYGVAPAGSGGYPDPVIYDSYYDASDITAVSPIDITPASIPAARVNVPYSVTFAASGGIGAPFFYALATVLPEPLRSELAMHPTTGVFSGTPSATYAGLIEVTATDGQSNTRTLQVQLTINPVVANDQAARLATDGTLFGTNFEDVYLGSGTGAAVLTPSRRITSTEQLLAAPYGSGGHKYTAAEGLYGQVRNGVLQGPFPDGTPRAELDTTTFGFNTLRLPGRANDGRQGGAWTCPLDGNAGTLRRRVYVAFRIYFDEEAIACAWDAPTSDHKIFMIGSNQDGQVVFGSKGNTGALSMYWDVSHSIGEIAGINIAANQNPWPRDVRRTYNAIDMGDTTLNGSLNTVDEQNKWSENYGPLDRGYNWGGYQYIADQKYLAQRDTTLLPNGYPDSRVFKNCPALRHSTWQFVEACVEKHVGEDLLSIEYWLAPDNQPFTKLFTALHSVPLSGGASDSYFTELQALEYATDRVRQSALDRNTWIREVQTSLKPIPAPGGYLPPNNRG